MDEIDKKAESIRLGIPSEKFIPTKSGINKNLIGYANLRTESFFKNKFNGEIQSHIKIGSLRFALSIQEEAMKQYNEENSKIYKTNICCIVQELYVLSFQFSKIPRVEKVAEFKLPHKPLGKLIDDCMKYGEINKLHAYTILVSYVNVLYAQISNNCYHGPGIKASHNWIKKFYFLLLYSELILKNGTINEIVFDFKRYIEITNSIEEEKRFFDLTESFFFVKML